VELSVDPAAGPADVVPRISVTGAPPGTVVELTIEVVDAAGHRWRSVVPLDEGADPAFPWWAMTFASDGVAPTAFVASAERLTYRVSVAAGTARADADAVRWWRADDVRTGKVDGDGFRLVTYTPPGDDAPAVLIVPGSTGVDAVAPQAALLASHGYRTAVLAYANEPGLPDGLREVPLEALAAGYRAFAGGQEKGWQEILAFLGRHLRE
jgi:hypothetical protein